MIAALIIVLACSALFSAAEAAVSVLGREWLEEESRRGASWAHTLGRMGAGQERFSRVALVGNIVLSTTVAVLWTAWVLRRPWAASETVQLLTALAGGILGVLMTGFLGPRLVALRHPVVVARWGLLPLAGLFRFFWALSVAVVWALGPLVRLVAGRHREVRHSVTEEEIKRVISEGGEAGVLDEEEQEMLHSVIEFNDKIAREVMVPRLDVVALEAGASTAEILRVALEEGFSRVPVYKGTLDNIVGIVHVKDLLRIWEHRDLIVLYDVMRRPHFIPETKKLSELLREFRTRNLHMAIVVDEFGGTEGLVTMEDILEEIVGDIWDEHDTEMPEITRMGEGQYVVEARMNLEDFAEELEVEVPPTSSESVGGFVVDLFGRIPRRGERVSAGGLVFEALEVEKRRLLRVRVAKEIPRGAEETRLRSDDN